MIKLDNATVYLDNAHTKCSIAFCKQWFEKEAQEEADRIGGVVKRVLLFFLAGEREPRDLLPQLMVLASAKIIYVLYKTKMIHSEKI